MMKNSVANSRLLSISIKAESLSGRVISTSASLLRVNSLAWIFASMAVWMVALIWKSRSAVVVAWPGLKSGLAVGKSCWWTLPAVRGQCSHASSAV